jgi:hypothetical protein
MMAATSSSLSAYTDLNTDYGTTTVVVVGGLVTLNHSISPIDSTFNFWRNRKWRRPDSQID